ncbi:hypothetical protein I553_7399 [Mycobacterium xenopi 4042]|uniref:Uncharacterized protein n=1 Tax=Mycobacterium xenopi 4042 TaxID=1299334 RepID=X8E874_MYCXE|nr:hypothetical protein I553_7399 [Mycobacterium xenopi 4042]
MTAQRHRGAAARCPAGEAGTSPCERSQAMAGGAKIPVSTIGLRRLFGGVSCSGG